MKQNSSTEFSACYFQPIYSKNGPPDLLDPKSAILSGFPGFPGFCKGSVQRKNRDTHLPRDVVVLSSLVAMLPDLGTRYSRASQVPPTWATPQNDPNHVGPGH